MKTIQHWIARYTAFLWALLKPLGAWGVFAIAAVDSAFVGMPLDPVVASYVYLNPKLFWLYAIMGAAGSSVGCIVLYLIGYMGGEMLIERRIGKERFDKMRTRFEEQEFFALMIPSMLPPPTPFKLFVLSAAILEMRLPLFLAAIFVGRVIRFLILSVLVIEFGPEVMTVTGNLLREHLGVSLAIAGGLVASGVLLWWFKVRRKAVKDNP